MQWWIGLLVPFLGTALGAACVFFLKDLCPAAEKVLLGLAAGVMVAASVWSLLLPALAGDAGPCPPWTAAAGGLLLGFFLLLALDRLLPEPQALPGAGRTLVLAVTLHNIPEGMAVGAALAGALAERHHLLLSGGSDFHGLSKPQVQLGKGHGGLRVSEAVLQRLKADREERGLPL